LPEKQAGAVDFVNHLSYTKSSVLTIGDLYAQSFLCNC